MVPSEPADMSRADGVYLSARAGEDEMECLSSIPEGRKEVEFPFLLFFVFHSGSVGSAISSAEFTHLLSSGNAFPGTSRNDVRLGTPQPS